MQVKGDRWTQSLHSLFLPQSSLMVPPIKELMPLASTLIFAAAAWSPLYGLAQMACGAYTWTLAGPTGP